VHQALVSGTYRVGHWCPKGFPLAWGCRRLLVESWQPIGEEREEGGTSPACLRPQEGQ